MMTAEQGVASFLFQLDRWPEALAHYERYYELASQLRARGSIGLSLLNRAKILWRLGRYPDAEKVLAEARTLSAQPGSDPRLPSLIAAYGAEMALSRSLFPEATALAQKVLHMESATKQIQATVRCVAGLAKARAGSAQEGKRLCDEGVSTRLRTQRSSLARGQPARPRRNPRDRRPTQGGGRASSPGIGKPATSRTKGIGMALLEYPGACLAARQRSHPCGRGGRQRRRRPRRIAVSLGTGRFRPLPAKTGHPGVSKRELPSENVLAEHGFLAYCSEA